MAFSTTLGRWVQADPIGYVDGMNSYQYERSDPISGRDPLGLYDEAGHFYTTYLVAIAAGYLPDDAYELAYYSQLPDEIWDYDAKRSGFDRAGYYGSVLNASGDNELKELRANNAFDKDIEELLHSLHGGDVEARRKCLAKLLQDRGLDPWERGLIIHALGDSYAHTYTSPARYDDTGSEIAPQTEESYGGILGHAFAGTKPDNLGNDPEKYKKYVLALYTALGGASNTASQNARLTSVLNMANTLKGASSDAAISAMSRLARTGAFGYTATYRPESGAVTDPLMDNLDRQRIQALMNKIRRACCPDKK